MPSSDLPCFLLRHHHSYRMRAIYCHQSPSRCLQLPCPAPFYGPTTHTSAYQPPSRYLQLTYLALFYGPTSPISQRLLPSLLLYVIPTALACAVYAYQPVSWWLWVTCFAPICRRSTPFMTIWASLLPSQPMPLADLYMPFRPTTSSYTTCAVLYRFDSWWPSQVPLLCRPTTPLQSCASSLTCLLLSPSIFTILPAFANAAIPLALLSLLICLVYQQLAHVLFKSCSCRLVPTVFFNSSHFSRQPVAFSGQLAHCLTSRAYHVPLVPPCHCLLCSPCPLSSYDLLR